MENWNWNIMIMVFIMFMVLICLIFNLCRYNCKYNYLYHIHFGNLSNVNNILFKIKDKYYSIIKYICCFCDLDEPYILQRVYNNYFIRNRDRNRSRTPNGSIEYVREIVDI